ncbi:Putative zinc- or iron-chelating domain protein [uncultured archaeon]|nr:Putative zinc- or iron-chelating domain protein [uncultured archaeon]
MRYLFCKGFYRAKIKTQNVSETRESFLDWLGDAIAESRFPQIAAQVLFQCHNCNECCLGEGYALVDEDDIQGIAQALGHSPSVARTRFTDSDPQKRKGYRILKSVGPEKCCIFLDKRTRLCTIYESRPRVCRAFPMLNPDPECGDIICFYPDCLGTAKFVKMLLEKSCDTGVKKEVVSLEKNAEKIADLKIMLYIWLQRITGNMAEAERVSSLTGVWLPAEESIFKRDCLAYFLMTITVDGLEEYRYEGHGGI